MEGKSSPNDHHAIVLSLPLQGHINPFIHLSLKLASRGVTITFLAFDFIHQQITQARRAAAGAGPEPDGMFSRPDGLDIRQWVASDGLPSSFDRIGEVEEYVGWYLYGGMYDKVEEAVGEIVLRSRPRVNSLITVTFYPWASKIAKKFGLIFTSFWTEPALVFNLYNHVNLLKQHGHFDCPGSDTRKDPIDYIPGVQSIDPKDLTSYLQDKDPSTNMHKLIFSAFQDVRNADFVLCNTVQALEQETISALQSLNIPFYPIGPVLQPGLAQSIGPSSLWAESDCSRWLDREAHGSVLYVSFGSLANFTRSDLIEIAYGLMLSNVHFVWVLRPRLVLDEAEGDDMLPLGFKDAVHGRGVIVPWTNQAAVLSHRAIGGFLTHCGWNSVLESIWFGTPMLCFPVFTVQPTNRKLVVEDWKIGIDLCDEKSIRREDIEARIKHFMSRKTRDDLECSIKHVRETMENALGADGSSERNIDMFLEKLKLKL